MKEKNTPIDKDMLSEKGTSNNSITATIVFGMPTKDCSYNGICRIEPEENCQEIQGKCIGLVNISTLGKEQLLFTFAKNKMNSKTIRKHFGSGFFIILEDFETPDFLSKAIGYNAVIIPQGIYEVNQNKTDYEVVFDFIFR